MTEATRGLAAKQSDRWRRAKERDEWARWVQGQESGPRTPTSMEEYFNGVAASLSASLAPLKNAMARAARDLSQAEREA